MTPPDERSRRLPGWRGGSPVVLCDGAAWWFPPPELGGTAGAFDRLLDAFIDAETAGAEALALYDLAFHLLGSNYDLDFADARALLCVYPEGDPRRGENEAMWDALADAALGIVPRSYSRWVRSTLLACNVPLPQPMDVARDILEQLVAAGRATPPAAWVARMTREAAAARVRAMPHNRI